jgi:SNF2 family DNA or RNA helicase
VPFVGELLPHQREAHDQLLEWGRGILGVIMGGGKTPTSIAVVETLLDAGRVEAGLVIVPSSVRRQWAVNKHKGLKKFAPHANVMLVEGTQDQRRDQYLKAMDWAEYVVMGYDQVVDDWDIVRRLPKDFVVLDEIQAIKNPESARTKKVRKLLRGCDFIFGLTGKPVENHPEDIFHICAAIDKTVLGHPQVFDATFVKRNLYGKAVEYVNLDLLHARLEETIMVRVNREEIAHELPERSDEEDVLIDFDQKSAALYRRVVRDLVEELEKSSSMSKFDVAAHYQQGNNKMSAAERAQRGRVMSRIMVARMVCDHPDLVRMSADLFRRTERVDSESTGLRKGSVYANQLVLDGALDGFKTGVPSPKMRVAIAEIKDILDRDESNKIVLFSFFKPTLTWLAVRLQDYGAVLFHGGMTPKAKEASVDALNRDPGTRVFLSSDAGGTGVDLPGGNHTINYDLPFSAGQFDQRVARIDRVSSEHETIATLNLLMAGSLEEYYADILRARNRLSDAVVDGKMGASRSVALPAVSLKRFLIDSPLARGAV